MKVPLKVLLLGGTRDAVNIANSLLALNKSGEQHIEIIYSIAGIVRQPSINCSIHTGGFSQFAAGSLLPRELADNPSQQGLKQFITQYNIDKVIDATHPYAVTVSTNASAVCELLNIPLFKYIRPPWQASDEDRWIYVNNWAEAKNAMHPFSRPFVTIGRTAVDDVKAIPDHQFWFIRTAIEENRIEDRYRLIKDIGPFTEDQEIELLKAHQIDVVVCKNSGGSAVDGKLKAARELQRPVIMINRPDTEKSYGSLYHKADDLIKSIIDDCL